MAKRYYSDWLKAFMDYSSFGEAPLKMLFWTGVSTVAGALRRRVWIDQKYFQWLPNFYIILVAPPGIVSKSTTANIGHNLLRPIQGIHYGPDSITWQALITSLASYCESVPDPRNPGDFYPMSAVTFCSDELGNLLKPKDGELIDALVALWDGKRGTFSKETKHSGNDKIENPWVNIIGCTTPAWISGNIPEYMIGGGFTSRCVFVYADKKRQFVPYVDEVVPPDFEETAKRLTHDLEMISMMFGEFEITAAARDWGRIWYKEHWEKPPTGLTTDQFSGYLARKQTLLHKMAMILSASAGDTMKIESVHLEAASAMSQAIEADMPKVFSRIGQTEITRGSYEILTLVEQKPGITQAQLYKCLFRTLSYQDFMQALTGVINSRQISSHQSASDTHYNPIGKKPDEQQAS